jgi:hypothetical protein
MKNRPAAMLVVVLALALVATGAFAKGLGTDRVSRVPDPTKPVLGARGFTRAELDTNWIFDADFSNTSGDNAGWTTYNRSGDPPQTNYWHIDTIRTTQAYLGTYTWWCGRDNICWVQPRGYGNDWTQYLSRHFTGVTGTGGDAVQLEWDQRYAMERLYDYGYVDISTDGGTTWTTLASYNNTGIQGAGRPMDWTGASGHPTVDLSAYAGVDVDLRFRFESDAGYSDQDTGDNTLHSVKDGAWQLDNIEISVNSVDTFLDDSESGDTGWTHDDMPANYATDVSFFRGQYGAAYDFETGRDFSCEDRPAGSWMYAACNATNQMADEEYTWLMSPPIYVSGQAKLVGEWDMWVDLPKPANDIFNLYLAASDLKECVTDPAGFIDEDPGWWYGGPFWGVWDDDWDAFAGDDWLAILWALQNNDTPQVDHMAGIFLNRQRVGVPTGEAGTSYELDEWRTFNDWFKEDLAEALTDTAVIKVKNDNGITSVYLMASNDAANGYPQASFEAYACLLPDPTTNEYYTPPPVNQMTPGSVIHYYWEATDGGPGVSTYPAAAPSTYFEMTILPVTATTVNPGILLVDKHGRRTPGEDRNYLHTSEYYYREMLGILGYEWETYDVEVPSGSTEQSDGPDTAGMKYYDTQIWWTDDFNAYTVKPPDQYNLIEWLTQASGGKERNLLLTGNDIIYDLMATENETLNFVTSWLKAAYVQNVVGGIADTVPGVADHAGGFDFMTDGQAILAGGCPDPVEEFDVVTTQPGPPAGAEVPVDYVDHTGSTSNAGCAYTDPSSGYQTVILGFGMEFMMDGTWNGGSSNYDGGYFKTGISKRVDLMDNIMTYFGESPTGDPTDVVDGGAKNMLSQAYPNPFNPITQIAYSVREAGPVTIQVYNVAGKVVRTLLDKELMEAGAAGHVAWDGRDDLGQRCASGVYFYRINAPGFTTSRKMVMLK